jgi:hypothetical protein
VSTNTSNVVPVFCLVINARSPRRPPNRCGGTRVTLFRPPNRCGDARGIWLRLRTKNTKVFDLKLTPMERMGEGIEKYKLNGAELRTQKTLADLRKARYPGNLASA